MLNLFGRQVRRKVLIRQILDLEQAQHELIVKNRIIGRKFEEQKLYLSEAFHEIRNALHVITGNIDLLTRETERYQLPDTSNTLVGSIAKVSQQLLEFLNAGIELAKADADISYQCKEEVVNIREWLQKVLSIHSGMIEAKEISTLCKVADDFPHHILTDPLLLGQIAGNLLSNAIRFGPAKSQIRIVCFENVNRWTLVISNESVIIDPDQLKQIFQPFHTLRHPESRTGLGLTITRKYVQLMKGTIKATCVGSRFLVWVNLPLAVPTLTPQEAFIRPTLDFPFLYTAKKILVIEDNVACQQLLRRFLTALGLHVIVTADNARDGMARAREMKPDLIFLDQYLPDENGMAILPLLRSEMKGTPVILMSGEGSPESEQSIQAGASEYILKPFGLSRLAFIVKKYLEEAA